MSLLEVKNLRTHFFTDRGKLRAVRGVDFDIAEGSTLGLVGESGFGKSVTALSVLNLVPYPGRIVSGEVIYKGKDLLRMDSREVRKIRGAEIGFIFQEPLTAFNPVFTIGEQISESLRIHKNMDKKESLERSVELLKEVGISAPERRVNSYPHQLSGGMRQRAMIAMALSCDPHLLIADEPTTALDVTIQAQILELIKEIQRERKMSMILITHDLGIVSECVDSIAIMYSGKIVEYGRTEEILKNPFHPYTSALIDSIPSIEGKRRFLKTIEGSVPDPSLLGEGCSFRDRCLKGDKNCKGSVPVLKEVRGGHWVSCFNI
ncbi:MAG: ATP-binding cassette domain-containing protein [Candidatus Omnitrophica bacterium]|nr:ATP-binding cassette domain-containing protein [Candidatus Omnitrophota bacterium]MBD3269273.1 ATP-binding cassette domain-containing protein [Candidatus Omnitrophota bacterium]